MPHKEKPRVHARDHEHGGADPQRIHYEDVGDEGGGSGGGIQFDVAPQDGGFLFLRTTGATSLSPYAGDGIVVAAAEDVDIESDDVVNVAGGVGVAITAQGNSGVTISTQGLGNLRLDAGIDSGIDIEVHAPALLRLIGLPTSNPGGSGYVWNDGGTLKIT